MPTYAHTETGVPLDPIPAATEAEYRKRFNAAITANWTVQVVADGTPHGGIPAPPPQIIYQKLQRGSRLDIVNDVFSAARWVAIAAAFDASQDTVLSAARERFKSETSSWSRAQMVDLFTALRAADIPTAPTKITAPEIVAIANHSLWTQP